MKIVVYGNADKDEKTGFPSEADFIDYIKGGIFRNNNDGRYQYSQQHDADIILLSREGKVYGYFVISGMQKPSIQDTSIAKNPRKVYLVKESILFENPVILRYIDITRYQFGKSITEDQFDKIKHLGGTQSIYTNQ